MGPRNNGARQGDTRPFFLALKYFQAPATPEGGGGDSAHERGGDARRKFWIKPLKGTDLRVAQALFDP